MDSRTLITLISSWCSKISIIDSQRSAKNGRCMVLTLAGVASAWFIKTMMEDMSGYSHGKSFNYIGT